MSIQVRSNEAPQPEAKPVTEAPKSESKSAPEQHSEQKSATESEPVEAVEAKEVDHEEESESEHEESQSSEEAEKDKPRKKGGFQRRIDKLNSRISERERELEYWKQLALKEKSAGEPKKEVQPAHAPQADGKPDPDKFDTHAEYVEALTEWKIEQREAAREQKAQRAKLETQQQEMVRSHQERVKAFAQTANDFQEVLEQVDDVPVSSVVQELIVSSENGPELMYELAKNREEFERINKLPPLAAARAMGRIESKIAASKESKASEPKTLTKAPKPIAPLGTGGKGSVGKSIDDPSISQAEYERLRREQMNRKR